MVLICLHCLCREDARYWGFGVLLSVESQDTVCERRNGVRRNFRWKILRDSRIGARFGSNLHGARDCGTGAYPQAELGERVYDTIWSIKRLAEVIS
jgi:hypothetical protein